MSSKQKVNGNEYCIRMKVDKGRKAMKVEARLLKNFLFQKITSKHTEILLFKEISNEQCVNNRESTLYVHRGSIVMTQWIYVCLGESMGRQKLTEFYAVLNRNLT